ncbi:glycosyltransferase [Mangrovimonas cancribranchiae]|uniref:Glycosyltransferase n=1 Tax=Mangrovimonas cancribranchiae TaxID=3080055 RepID=A0AAU6P123_9FLAO
MKHKQVKITFIIPSLAAGGAERILSFVAKNINKNTFKPTLLVIGFKKDTVYNVSNLDVIYLNKSRVLKAIIPIIRYLKTEQPHIVLTSIYHLNTMVAYLSVFFPKIKFVAREANVLSVLAKHGGNKLTLSKKLIIKAYKLIDVLICQSLDMQQDMIANYGVSKHKTILINNPITTKVPPKKLNTNKPSILKIITVGRLSKEKGHDRIIEVLSHLKIPFKYFMIGDGNEKKNILHLIDNKGINNHVTHINYTNDVENYLRESDVFLLGSYSEGFPNVLLESCVVGTPIIAFNAPGGINEIIETGKNGYIVNSVDDCVNKLTQLYLNFEFSPKQVNQVVIEKFNKEKIIKQYENLFLNLTTNYVI